MRLFSIIESVTICIYLNITGSKSVGELRGDWDISLLWSVFGVIRTETVKQQREKGEKREWEKKKQK